jgi:hypothetical protein
MVPIDLRLSSTFLDVIDFLFQVELMTTHGQTINQGRSIPIRGDSWPGRVRELIVQLEAQVQVSLVSLCC